jgi:uncharacterized protein (TIGR00255 family)
MSIHSMTGFGRGTCANDVFQSAVEISSVNRKQVEFALTASRDLNCLEPRIRQSILQRVSRGRIQVNISVAAATSTTDLIEVDLRMARALEDAFTKLSAMLGRELVPTARDFTSMPGMFRAEETSIDPEEAWLVIEPAMIEAMKHFLDSRSQEGSALLHDVRTRLKNLQVILEAVTAAAPGRSARQSAMLLKRLAELNCPVNPDDDRVLKEIALFAERCDISEEITRLHCHFEKFHEYLRSGDSPGRALDFLCQEIHREFNTIGSKANDSGIAQSVVSGKTELEKIREQVQNIE